MLQCHEISSFWHEDADRDVAKLAKFVCDEVDNTVGKHCGKRRKC